MVSKLVTRDRQVVWHPFTTPDTPIKAITSGRGAILYDDGGNAYIDAISSWWVNTHGHAHPYITKKITEQLAKIHHVIFAGFTHEPAVLLAERLLSKLPPNQSKVFYSDDGSTAVEVAIKMAIQCRFNIGDTRRKIVALEGAYHGDTFGAMSAGGRGVFVKPFLNMLFDVIHIPLTLDDDNDTLARLEEALSTDDAVAFIYEPLIQGAGGMRMYSPDTLNSALKICKKYDVIKIADEVMTGFYRTGRFFASDYCEEKPDIICLSKGLTGGTLALSVTSCSDEIYNALNTADKEKSFFHGHSFTANPLACVSALASLDLFEEDQCLSAISKLIESQGVFLGRLRAHPKVANARQQGTVVAFDVVNSGESSYLNPLRERLYEFFVDRGVLLRPLGDVIYVMPPYCISELELDRVYTVIFEALNEIV